MSTFSYVKVSKQAQTLQTFVTEILEEAFPLEERRDTKEFWEIVFSNPHVQCFVVEKESQPLAFYYIWEFDSFIYIEFIAVAKPYRSQGLFSIFFKEILQQCTKVIICEAERVDTVQAQRRMALYRRLGFIILSDTYMQPPFRTTDTPQSMYLLAYANNMTIPPLEHIISILYSEVYGIPYAKLS